VWSGRAGTGGISRNRALAGLAKTIGKGFAARRCFDSAAGITMFMRDRSVPAPRGSPQPFATETLWRDWRVLCEDIGERRAGTVAEAEAAGYIARRFRECGADQVDVEIFPCTSRRSERVEVHERDGRAWRRIEASALVGAPGTPGGRPVTGELTWLELPESTRRIRPRSLRGKIAAVFGPLPTAVEVHRRLVAAHPLVVIHVDDRLPFPWIKNDGVYPHWAHSYGMPPTITVPYLEAWRWRQQGVKQIKVRVVLEQARAKSQNVVAEFRGTAPELPAVVLTAHHDTQCNNVGADDNASGVVALLALARALAGPPRARTVRLISFGTEEQLSVGSFAYVRKHRPTPAEVGLVLNFDSISSPLGHFMMSVAGAPALSRFASRELARARLDVRAYPEITPFSDQFPFNRAGVPSLWFMRTNFPGGRWQHHSSHDSLENVSLVELQRLLEAVHPLVTKLATSRKWPFPSRLPAAQQSLARQLGRELFG
jgi:hypothetical protein